MFMQRRSQFDKSEKWAYFVSWCVVGSPSFLQGTTRGLYVTTHPPAIQKQQWHSKEAQIEPPLIEGEREWAFRIQALMLNTESVASNISYNSRGGEIIKRKVVNFRVRC
jgi:hypothetical protein